MNDRDESLSQLYSAAFVDGELTRDERALALQRMEADALFKADACALRTLKDRVQDAYAELPPPPGRALPARHPGAAQVMAACLLLAVGIGVGWLAHDFNAVEADFSRIAGLPQGYQAVALSQQVDQDKIILHLDSGDPHRLIKVLDLADGLLMHNAGARIQIVVNSDGLNLLRADVTPLAERIEQLAHRHANLSFVACGQTVARLKREGVKVNLVPVALTASSAIGEITTRMGQGWVYIKA